ncbi:hypothetical protein D8B26_001108 [Coccidioides posadasii str. Silveira]|uniref:Uncharacterized protein n=1 Tax=Coccidioides posadasii (strain RMSCC 757 / Silveira) TaxID=443226 RepID=E9CTT0_COCPS|nr:conserved hypothetical protein [Coccidioides posadasii str. Silveira]QVM06395.1 hypothetical protein D8B26_001108 [Coccidioides posadasii str. Silveira]
MPPKRNKKGKDKDKGEKVNQGKKISKKQKPQEQEQQQAEEQQQVQPPEQPDHQQDPSEQLQEQQGQDHISDSPAAEIPSDIPPSASSLASPNPDTQVSPAVETLPEPISPTSPVPLQEDSLNPTQDHVEDSGVDQESEKAVAEPTTNPQEESEPVPEQELEKELEKDLGEQIEKELEKHIEIVPEEKTLEELEKELEKEPEKEPEEEPEKEPEKGLEREIEKDPENEPEKEPERDFGHQPEADLAEALEGQLEHDFDKENGKETEDKAQEELEYQPSPKVLSPALCEVPPAPVQKAEPNLVNVSDSLDKSAESVSTPPEIVPKTQRPPSVAEFPAASPILSSARPKTTSSPVYGYSQSRSPAPVHSPHYTYSVPYTHPYAPSPIYANGSLHDLHSSGPMAVSGPPHCSPAPRPSALDGYHSRMASRGSFGRGHPDYPFNLSYHQPKQRPSTPTQQKPVENGNSESLPIEGDTIKLLQRIQNVIPDINRLVTSYRDTQNQLSSHVAQSKQIEEQHERSLMEKEFYIDALQAQIQKTAKENAAESAKLRNRISELRMELGGLQEQHRDVADSLEELKKANDELTLVRSSLEQQIANLQRTMQDEKASHLQELKRREMLKSDALAAQKEELQGHLQEMKKKDDQAAAEKLRAREEELYGERDQLKAEWEQQMAALNKSKDDMAAEYEGKLDTKKTELETKQGELDAKQAELQAKQSELDARQEELNATKSDLEAKQAELVDRQKELEEKQSEVEAKQEEINRLKSELESKIAELEDKRRELEQKQGELESKQTELQAIQDELQEVKAELEEKKSQLESKQADLDKKQEELTAKQAELDDVKEKHAAELAALRAQLEEQTNATKERDEKIEAMTTEHQQKEEQWQKDRGDFEAQLQEKTEELKVALEEKEALAVDGKNREERLQSIVEEMRQTHDNLNKDRERLKKTLHSLGEATDMKIKGDAFFVDCFGELSRLIVDLSKEFFAYIPIEPPADILAKIPSDLPPFLDNTPASRELRSAYVQHVISKTLTYRIFQPFLFTLGRRYDKADTFFQVLSMDIRRKSVRREAFWRQQTLRAAYTASDAKQAINVVAAVIVDEIVDHIRHFTDPKHLDALITSVRKIVKLAAETWRLARVERELIVASMPSADDEQAANDLWEEFIYDQSSAKAKESGGPKVPLLRMLPRIHREPVHEDFLQPEEAEKANPCVYLPGVILYTDSPSVIARREEISRKTADPSAPADGAGETNGAENQTNGEAEAKADA